MRVRCMNSSTDRRSCTQCVCPAVKRSCIYSYDGEMMQTIVFRTGQSIWYVEINLCECSLYCEWAAASTGFTKRGVKLQRHHQHHISCAINKAAGHASKILNNFFFFWQPGHEFQHSILGTEHNFTPSCMHLITTSSGLNPQRWTQCIVWHKCPQNTTYSPSCAI